MLAFAFISSSFFCASSDLNLYVTHKKHRPTHESRISRKCVWDGVLESGLGLLPEDRAFTTRSSLEGRDPCTPI
jgi:hypothetical protein